MFRRMFFTKIDHREDHERRTPIWVYSEVVGPYLLPHREKSQVVTTQSTAISMRSTVVMSNEVNGSMFWMCAR